MAVIRMGRTLRGIDEALRLLLGGATYHRVRPPRGLALPRSSDLRGTVSIRRPGGRIIVGEDCVIEGSLVTETEAARIQIGSNTFIGGGTLLACAEDITIGNDVLVSYQGLVVDSDNHDIGYQARKGDLQRWRAGLHDLSSLPTARVRVEDGAWIGARAIILKGVVIGEGSVVGAGSVVTTDVAPYTMVAGNPARLLREIEP